MSHITPSGPPDANIMIVGDFPDGYDMLSLKPFSGPPGMELAKLLHDAGIMQSACYLTHALKTRPPGGDIANLIALTKRAVTPAHLPFQGKMLLPEALAAVDKLREEISLVRPNVIIPVGNFALWALTGEWGVSKWRGSVLRCAWFDEEHYAPLVVPTFSPQYVQKVWEDRGIAVQDLRRAAPLAHIPASPHLSTDLPPFAQPTVFTIRPDFSAVMERLLHLSGQVLSTPLRLSVDLETRSGHIACCGLAWSETEALCIPFMCTENDEGYWNADEEAAIVYRLYLLFTHPNIRIIGQNFLYDAQYIYRHWHFIPRVSRDTMIAQHVLFAGMPKGLDYLSSIYCKSHVYWKDESKNWDPKLGEDQLWIYNCKDAVITYEVDSVLQKTVAAIPKLSEPHDFQQSLFYPVLHTMLTGIRQDTESKLRYAEELQNAIDERECWLYNVLGHEINIKSPKQLSTLFYGDLAQKPVVDRKTGSPSTNEASLQTIASREPLLRPLINCILELRSLGVFLSTFVSAPVDVDGRIRCSFNITGTVTYRFSSSENAFGSGLNLQNIPSGDETDSHFSLPNVRKLFLADPGYTFFDIDLDSADLRIVVWESNCKEMKQMFAEGLKPYVEVAKEYYRDPSITKSHPAYATFKALCHGTNYLGTAKGLAPRVGLNIADVERVQRWYFGKFPEIAKWQEDLIKRTLSTKQVTNIFGYRMPLLKRFEGTVRNEIVAWVPQSTVACLINRGYRNIYRNLPKTEYQVLLQVHDSLAGQYSSYLGDKGRDEIVKQCSITLPYPDPLIIPVGIKTSPISWGHCK